VTSEEPITEPYYDVCQKIARLGNDGVFGIAGRLDVVKTVSHWLTGTYKERGLDWLTNKGEVVGLLLHLGVLGEADGAEFLTGFMHRGRAKLVHFNTDGVFSITGWGLELIGSGSVVRDRIRPRLVAIMNFAGPGQTGIPLAQRSMFFSEMVVQECRNEHIESVGGLMQINFVTSDGVFALPYERWVDLGNGLGTYVTMDIDEVGAWVQKHQPTGLTVPLRFPGEEDFMDPEEATGQNFQLEKLLSFDSMGVSPTPNPVHIYRPITTSEGEMHLRTP